MNKLQYIWYDKKYLTNRRLEKILLWMVWRLPHKLVMWCAIRVISHATTGKWGNQNVPELSAVDAMKRWDESSEGPMIAYTPPTKTVPTEVAATVYRHTNSKGVTYFLNEKIVHLRGGKAQPIRYFSKDLRPEGIPLPEGFEIRENPRNGFLTVRTPEMLEQERKRAANIGADEDEEDYDD